MDTTTNPELDAIYKDLKVKVDALIKDFWEKMSAKLSQEFKKATTMPNVPGGGPNPGVNLPSYKNLPWFQHGIRGFLQKLWYGDHPQNPSWTGVKRESTEKFRLSLKEHANIRGTIEQIVYVRLIENDVTSDGLAVDFTNALMATIQAHLKTAFDLGYQRTSAAPEKAADPAAAPSLPSTAPAATPAPAAETPTLPVDPKSTSPKQMRKRIKKTSSGAEVASSGAMFGKPPAAAASTEPANAPTPAAPAAEAKPVEKDATDELDPEKIEDAVLKFVVAKEGGKEEGIKEALSSAGVKFTSNGNVSGRSANILVQLMHKMSADGDLGLGEHDWIDLDSYESVFGNSLPTKNISTAIRWFSDILKANPRTVNRDMDKRASTGVSGSSADSPFESRTEKIEFFKKLLRESDQNYLTFVEARKLPASKRVEFLRECL